MDNNRFKVPKLLFPKFKTKTVNVPTILDVCKCCCYYKIVNTKSEDGILYQISFCNKFICEYNSYIVEEDGISRMMYSETPEDCPYLTEMIILKKIEGD